MKPSRILIVDDDPGQVRLIGRVVAGLGQVRLATSGEQALRLLHEQAADLVLLDSEMPGLSGPALCALIKADPALAETAVIFVTGHSDPEHELRGLELGAVDFIAKPISEPLLLARVKTQLRLKQLADELRELADVDPLTGVHNRRSFAAALEHEWQRALRSGTPLALLMVDVDHFKAYNDHYGHVAGDGALRAVAGALRLSLRRPADRVARYGGEEFALLLPDTDRAGAWHVARQLHHDLAALALPHAASPAAPVVTVSVGVSGLERVQGGADGALSLVAAADRALYRAKAGGRACSWWLGAQETDAAQALPVPAAALQPAGTAGA